MLCDFCATRHCYAVLSLVLPGTRLVVVFVEDVSLANCGVVATLRRFSEHQKVMRRRCRAWAVTKCWTA